MNNRPLINRVVCLSELSKDVEGELRVIADAVPEECRSRDCKTLMTFHHLDLKVFAHACDSGPAGVLDGQLIIDRLVHKYMNGDGERRGVHEALFEWYGSGVLAAGTLTGVTNSGTHRPPAFGECQSCDALGVMEGMLVGTILRDENDRLFGCELRAAYRLRFDASATGGEGGVQGTIEGSIVCDCEHRPRRICVDFDALSLGIGPNPRVEQGVRFTVYDFSGAPAPDTQITMKASSIALDVLYKTEIVLPVSCSAVEGMLVTGAQPANLEAFDITGASVGTASMTPGQGVVETLRVTGPAISTVVITAPANETWLLGFCFEPAA